MFAVEDGRLKSRLPLSLIEQGYELAGAPLDEVGRAAHDALTSSARGSRIAWDPSESARSCDFGYATPVAIFTTGSVCAHASAVTEIDWA